MSRRTLEGYLHSKKQSHFSAGGYFCKLNPYVAHRESFEKIYKIVQLYNKTRPFNQETGEFLSREQRRRLSEEKVQALLDMAEREGVSEFVKFSIEKHYSRIRYLVCGKTYFH